ncbi:MAG: phosphodiester glycosidase family protein [Chloroflexota bacterium]
MKFRNLLLFALTWSLLSGAAFQRIPPPAGGDSPWQALAAGIDYQEFYLEHPNHLYVTRMQRDQANLTLDSSIAQGRLSGGLETVRDMAARYDQSIAYWDGEWGARYQVVAAINGYFYDTESGIPRRGQVQSGWYARRFDDRENASGFAWTMERQAFIGGCVVHPRNKQLVKFLEAGEELNFDGLNTPRGDDDLVIYTPQYDASTLTGDEGFEALVELERPLGLIPAPAMVEGVVRVVRDGQGNMPLPFDHVALSASGAAAEPLRKLAQVGARVGISQEMRHLQPDCRTPNLLDWSGTYAAIGGSFYFLKDGAVQALGELGAVLRSPRTALAFNDRYIFFIVVDGRDDFSSLGMSMVELALFARNRLGARSGVALDGGGSSTMIVNGELKNRPNTEVQDPAAQEGRIERAVANGMFMAVVLPRELSGRFQVGQALQTTGETTLRLGPGDNYAVLAALPAGSTGVVVEHSNGLNGVLAKGTYWWKVAFGDLVGWVEEEGIR